MHALLGLHLRFGFIVDVHLLLDVIVGFGITEANTWTI